MDYQVVWSPAALEDVESIASYIARDSEFYAASVVRRVIDTTRNLAHFPMRGRVVPELNNESIHEQFVYSYRTVYRVKEGTVTIAPVIHGKRLLAPILERIGNV
jgi:plasmid stabilization system protein ParE